MGQPDEQHADSRGDSGFEKKGLSCPSTGILGAGHNNHIKTDLPK
jgi:hypothetical protein